MLGGDLMWRVYVPLAVIVVTIVWGHGYFTGRNFEAQDFAEYKAQIKAEMAVLEHKNEEQRRHYDKVSKDAAVGYEAAIAAHARGTGRIRVQQCPGNRAGMPVPAAAADKPEQATVEPGHSTGRAEAVSVSAERCEEIANRAVMDAAQVLHLQAFYNGIRAAYGVEEYP